MLAINNFIIKYNKQNVGDYKSFGIIWDANSVIDSKYKEKINEIYFFKNGKFFNESEEYDHEISSFLLNSIEVIDEKSFFFFFERKPKRTVLHKRGSNILFVTNDRTYVYHSTKKYQSDLTEIELVDSKEYVIDMIKKSEMSDVINNTAKNAAKLTTNFKFVKFVSYHVIN